MSALDSGLLEFASNFKAVEYNDFQSITPIAVKNNFRNARSEKRESEHPPRRALTISQR